MDTSNSYFLLKNLSGSHLHIICIRSFPGALIDKLYSLIIVYIYVNDFFFSFVFSWMTHGDMYILSQTSALGDLLLWNDFLGSIWGFLGINIFTYVRYNYNHEIRKSTSFWLVPFGDGVFLLVTEAGTSGTSSLKTSNSLKILVGFSWKGKDMKTWQIKKVRYINRDYNFKFKF